MVQVVGVVTLQFLLEEVEAGGQPAVLDLVGVGRQGMGHLFRFVLVGDQRRQGAEGLLPECPAGLDDRLLFEVAYYYGGVPLETAAVGIFFAGQDLQQRGLARAVGAGQPDPLARMDLEGHPVKHGLRAVVFADCLGRKDDHPGFLVLLDAKPRLSYPAATRLGRPAVSHTTS